MKTARLAEWMDRHSGPIFVLPAVLLILAFSIFPLVISAWLALSQFRLGIGGYEIRFVGLLNFKKLLTGSQQFHFLGTFAEIPLLGWLIVALVFGTLAVAAGRYVTLGRVSVIGVVGRLISFTLIGALAVLFATTLGGQIGSLSTTLFYVIVGVTLQFLVGTGLAFLCAQNIRGRSFFRLVFFVPLMVTPVGTAYTFRMLADTTVGPFAPIWGWLGLGNFAWAADPWTARLVIVLGDSWQWIPFIFIVMLAAFESQPRDQVEAAQVDGASTFQIFRDITWPSVAPVAATVVLIRVIEAFKIVDLPNVLTNGGPGIATESLTLHAFIEWRALNLGGSAAIAYLLLFVATVLCVSFVNMIVVPMRRSRQ
ncbi:sugar ABC transporter permease [Sinorhizobium garamanticum]|uniref:Sugar ABC transporter permease n=1 Tax=Sinorhizobium garamanticum TaxID=680247 RepID=A0ABY8DA62_9HYPH|nr:sugar ABC transporter permease [Sinorhizobium garamanticum]WEX87780.1 sugar ABC transporter permease [Sinorhizobium garamanticum]